MCESVFKNQEEKKRKEDFTRLFVALVNNAASEAGITTVKKADKAI